MRVDFHMYFKYVREINAHFIFQNLLKTLKTLKSNKIWAIFGYFGVILEIFLWLFWEITRNNPYFYLFAKSNKIYCYRPKYKTKKPTAVE